MESCKNSTKSSIITRIWTVSEEANWQENFENKVFDMAITQA